MSFYGFMSTFRDLSSSSISMSSSSMNITQDSPKDQRARPKAASANGPNFQLTAEVFRGRRETDRKSKKMVLCRVSGIQPKYPQCFLALHHNQGRKLVSRKPPYFLRSPEQWNGVLRKLHEKNSRLAEINVSSWWNQYGDIPTVPRSDKGPLRAILCEWGYWRITGQPAYHPQCLTQEKEPQNSDTQFLRRESESIRIPRRQCADWSYWSKNENNYRKIEKLLGFQREIQHYWQVSTERQ